MQNVNKVCKKVGELQAIQKITSIAPTSIKVIFLTRGLVYIKKVAVFFAK